MGKGGRVGNSSIGKRMRAGGCPVGKREGEWPVAEGGKREVAMVGGTERERERGCS